MIWFRWKLGKGLMTEFSLACIQCLNLEAEGVRRNTTRHERGERNSKQGHRASKQDGQPSNEILPSHAECTTILVCGFSSHQHFVCTILSSYVSDQ